MGQQSRLETIHAIYTFHLDNLGTPCCNGYHFLDAPHDAHCEDVVCGFVVEVRGSWKALISRCRERGGGLLQSSQLRNRNDWSCGAQSCLLMYKHPGSVDIIFLYVFVGPSRMLEWWCPTHGRFLDLGMGWFTMSRNPRIPWCCVSARGNLSAEVVPFLTPCSAATESI